MLREPRLEHDEKKVRTWNSSSYLLQVVLTYNNSMVHSAIKMTPSEARKEKKQFKVKINFQLGSKRNRVCPELTEGDQVKVTRKWDFRERTQFPLVEGSIYNSKD